MGRIRSILAEWKARRAGRKFVSRDLSKSAREIIGPTGDLLSGAWETMAEGSDAYIDSFDRRIPPSIFVSERDRKRMNRPIPLPERAIEHYNEGDGLTAEEIEWGRGEPGD